VPDDDRVVAADRRVRGLQSAVLWVGVGLLAYLALGIAILGQVRLPATLPGWFILFFVPLIGGFFAIPILQSRIAHYKGAAAQAQIAATLRSIDELEREQDGRRS
jgi:hypothetical protein